MTFLILRNVILIFIHSHLTPDAVPGYPAPLIPVIGLLAPSAMPEKKEIQYKIMN